MQSLKDLLIDPSSFESFTEFQEALYQCELSDKDFSDVMHYARRVHNALSSKQQDTLLKELIIQLPKAILLNQTSLKVSVGYPVALSYEQIQEVVESIDYPVQCISSLSRINDKGSDKKPPQLVFSVKEYR